jgi:hypothetical protein
MPNIQQSKQTSLTETLKREESEKERKGKESGRSMKANF